MPQTTPRFDIAEATELLERTPNTLRAQLDGLSTGWLDSREAPGTWSPREVVAHLIVGERTDWMPRLQIILEHGSTVPFEPFDRGAHLRPVDALPPEIDEALDELADLRWQNLDALRGLGLQAPDLARRGTHPTLGEVTVSQLLAAWVAHDQTHLAQVCRVLAMRYQTEVGPWDHPDYLGILHLRRG